MNGFTSLSSENIESYFNEVISPHLDGSQFVSATEVTELSQVHWVYAVKLRQPNDLESTIFVKQSRDTVKKYPELERPASRIDVESRALTFLSSIAPDLVAEVIYFDKENHAITMHDVVRGGNNLFNELREGRGHPEAGTYFGDAIAKIQLATFGKSREEILGEGVEPIADLSTGAILGNRTEAAMRIFPDLTLDVLSQCDEEGLSTFVLGDLTPTNTVVEDPVVRLLDFERTSIGDPSIDLSRLFSNYLVESQPSDLNGSVTAINNFMRAYLSGMSRKLEAPALNRLQNRVVRMLGLMILHRTQGTYFIIDVGEDKGLWQKRAEQLMSSTKSTSLESAIAGTLGMAA